MTSNSSLPLPQKITQLQCHECNSNLQFQFVQWISQSFKYKPALLNKIQDQIELIMGYADYKFTIARGKAQPGDFLQNIQFRNISKKTQVLWLMVNVVLPYLVKKIHNYAANQEGQTWKFVENMLLKVQKIVTILSFVNYAVFILKGQYRSLVQRILKIKMQFIDSDNKRILDFSLMNRMLVWKVYQFFLKNILPSAFSLVNGPLKNIFYLSSFLQPDTKSQMKGCIFCLSPTPIMPYQALPCNHRACYYCHRQNQDQTCKKCSVVIEKWRPIVK